MDGYFVLNEQGEPRLEPDIEAWSRWFERADRSVARTVVSSGITVLTTFRGVGETNERGRRHHSSKRAYSAGFSTAKNAGAAPAPRRLPGTSGWPYWCRIGNTYNHGITAAQLR